MGVGTTQVFPLPRGGRQGGVGTPRELNYIIEAIFEELTPRWDLEQLGYRTREGSRFIHHLWRADNYFMVGKSREEIRRMLSDVTEYILWLGMEWKTNSLKLLPGVGCRVIDQKRLARLSQGLDPLGLLWDIMVEPIGVQQLSGVWQ